MGKKRKNPFTPGAGKVPPHRAGHEDAARELFGMVDRVGKGDSADGAVLCGPRGVGKTALLGEMRERAEKRKARVIGLDTRLMTGRPDDKLGAMLAPRRWLPLLTVRGLMSMLPGGGGTGMGPGHIETSAVGVVLRLLLKDPLLVIVDDAHEMPPGFAMLLLQVAQQCVHDGLPLLVALAGTPGIESALIRSRTDCWEGFPLLRIGRLESKDDIRAALSTPAGRSGLPFADGALEPLVEASQGYPPFIQFLGEQAWEAAVGRDPGTSRIELGDAQAGVRLADELRGDFYKERRDEAETRKILPEAEAVAKAFAELGGDGGLSEAQLENAVRPVLSEGRTVKDATDELSALGLVWERRNLAWEQGIPSLCTYLAGNAKTG